jgi:hypothetical protein
MAPEKKESFSNYDKNKYSFNMNKLDIFAYGIIILKMCNINGDALKIS